MMELATRLISIYQALQLVGLAPCLFVMIFLGATGFRNKQAFVPLFYFLALFCSFLLPLVGLSHELSEQRVLHGVLLVGQSMLVACCFLLVMQFMRNAVPPLRYWLVLLVPILGGGFIVYASLIAAPEACELSMGCISEESTTLFYNLFSSALVMLLLIYYAARYKFHAQDTVNQHHHYWLAIVLVILHLALLAFDLLLVGQRIDPMQAAFSSTIIKLGFIYLVLTSLFRVYSPIVTVEVSVTPKFDEAADKALVEQLEILLDEQHIFREMRLNRAALAAKLGVGENTLSRVMNSYLGQSFNELINSRRIEDAKARLLADNEAISLIAADVGFNSTASFNRVFKELVGMSPTQFRQVKKH